MRGEPLEEIQCGCLYSPLLGALTTASIVYQATAFQSQLQSRVCFSTLSAVSLEYYLLNCTPSKSILVRQVVAAWGYRPAGNCLSIFLSQSSGAHYMASPSLYLKLALVQLEFIHSIPHSPYITTVSQLPGRQKSRNSPGILTATKQTNNPCPHNSHPASVRSLSGKNSTAARARRGVVRILS